MSNLFSWAAFVPPSAAIPFGFSSASTFVPRVSSRHFRCSTYKPLRATNLKHYRTSCETTSPSPTKQTGAILNNHSNAGAAEQKVRVRFAPSPTGALHVGGARTALYNWLMAKKSGGDFIIRVEDTDLARSTRESETMVLNDLKWLGLHWDEGPDTVSTDDNFVGPYRQSERSEIYRRYAYQLLDEGKAYACFCTEEELEAKRVQAEQEGRPPQYDGTWRDADPKEVERRMEAGEPYTIRFRVPEDEEDGSTVVTINDAVRGKVSWDANATVGDFILLRSNGIPVYNFCVAIDDALMKITTVIRAEEHLTNTLRQVLILQALGFDVPQYAHCSLILGSDRSKLSKRHGATSITQFKLNGYLPHAMINYLAALGWNDGTDKETYTIDEMIEAFDMYRITKSPAMFDDDKLRFLNGQLVRSLSIDDVEPMLVSQWLLHKVFTPVVQPGTRLAYVASTLVHGSLELVNDCVPQLQDVLTFPLQTTIEEDDAAKELLSEEGGFKQIAEVILRDYDAGVMPVGDKAEEHPAIWKKWVKTVGKETGRKGKKLFHPLRLALTGKMSGPDVGTIVELLYLAGHQEAAPGMIPLGTRIKQLRETLTTV